MECDGKEAKKKRRTSKTKRKKTHKSPDNVGEKESASSILSLNLASLPLLGRNGSSAKIVAKSKGPGDFVSFTSRPMTRKKACANIYLSDDDEPRDTRRDSPKRGGSCIFEPRTAEERGGDEEWDRFSPSDSSWAESFQKKRATIVKKSSAAMGVCHTATQDSAKSSRSLSMTHAAFKKEDSEPLGTHGSMPYDAPTIPRRVIVRKRSQPTTKTSSRDAPSEENSCNSLAGRISPVERSDATQGPSNTWSYPIPSTFVLPPGGEATKKRMKGVVGELDELRARLSNLERREKWRTEATSRHHVLMEDLSKLGIVGRGGSGSTVWKCKISGMLCAAKILDTNKCMPCEQEALEAEIMLYVSLVAHENIMKYLFHANIGALRCIFFSYYDDTLEEFLHVIRDTFEFTEEIAELSPRTVGKHPLQENDILKIALEIAKGVEFLHRNNIIHRDLKSGNIFISYARSSSNVMRDLYKKKHFLLSDIGQVVVGDLDVSMRYDNVTSPRELIGTVGYMAPELGQKECTEKIDVFAFGMILYELVSLRHPYYNIKWDVNKHNAILEGEPPVMHQLLESRYPKIIELHRRCIQTAASKRPSMTEVCNIIETCIYTP